MDRTLPAPPPPAEPTVVVPQSGRRVPWRVIWASIASVLLAALLLAAVVWMRRLLLWLLVAAFLAVALNPAVDLLVRRLHLRRGVATTIVMLTGVVLLVGLVVLFVRPLVTQGAAFADDLPRYVRDARAGRGPVGDLVRRFDLDRRLSEQSETIKDNIGRLGTQSVRVLSAVGAAVVSVLTVFVLTFMILLEADRLVAGVLAMVPPRHRRHVERVAGDCSRAVSGYVTGNLVISLVAGLSSWVTLLVTGVPFAGVLALWVGVTDLIPLVGATLGAVVVVAVAFLHSVPAGVVVLVFFVVYQQLENHLLQPAVQSRTVHLNPLTVLVSVLAGVELAGVLGALLAIPVAGMVQVVLRDVQLGLSADLPPDLDARLAEAAGPAEDGVTVGTDRRPVDDLDEPAFVDVRDGEVVTPADQLTGSPDP